MPGCTEKLRLVSNFSTLLNWCLRITVTSYLFILSFCSQLPLYSVVMSPLVYRYYLFRNFHRTLQKYSAKWNDKKWQKECFGYKRALNWKGTQIMKAKLVCTTRWGKPVTSISIQNCSALLLYSGPDIAYDNSIFSSAEWQLVNKLIRQYWHLCYLLITHIWWAWSITKP
jgi:hypothetical protein